MMSYPADWLPLALTASRSFALLNPSGFGLSAKRVRGVLMACPTLLVSAVSVLPAKLREPNALPPDSSTPTGNEVRPR